MLSRPLNWSSGEGADASLMVGTASRLALRASRMLSQPRTRTRWVRKGIGSIRAETLMFELSL